MNIAIYTAIIECATSGNFDLFERTFATECLYHIHRGELRKISPLIDEVNDAIEVLDKNLLVAQRGWKTETKHRALKVHASLAIKTTDCILAWCNECEKRRGDYDD